MPLYYTEAMENDSIISIKHLHCFGHMMLIIFTAWPKLDCNFAIIEMQFECNHLSDSVCLSICLSVCESVCLTVGTIFHLFSRPHPVAARVKSKYWC